MRRVGNQMARRIEQRAAEVEPLLDVHRIRRVLQLQPHLLGDVHEEVVEELQQHGVGRSAHRAMHGARRTAVEQQVVKVGQLRLPAGFDHRGGILLGNDGRAGDHVARAQIFAHHQCGIVPGGGTAGAHGVHAHGAAARHLARRVHCVARLHGGIAGQHGLDRHGLHHQALALHEKRKTLAVGVLECDGDLGLGAKRHDQGRIGALVAHMHAAMHHRRASARLLALQLGARRAGQRIQRGFDARQCLGRQRAFHGLLADHVLIGQAHAIGAQHARQRVHKNLRHAQCVGHQAGVLAARAAKALQGVARHVVAAGHADLLDGIGHLLHGDLDETVGHFLRRSPGLHGERTKLCAHHVSIQRFVGRLAKHLRKMRRLDLAHHHVRIGHGQRAAPAVAGGAGMGARTLGADTKAGAVKAQHRAATGRHRVDAHHGRAHAHASHLCLKLALECARIVAHIGAGAAHVEADHAIVPRQLRSPGHAHNAARRAREDGVLALKVVRVRQPARGLHEEQRHARHLARDLRHIAAQDGRQISIHHRGVAPAHELHHGAGGVRRADLREPRLLGQAGGRLLVGGVTPAMHEHDGHAAQARIVGGPQALFEVLLIQRLDHLAVRAHALLRLDHAAVKQLGQHDVPVKQARAVLIGNAQCVAKAFGGDEQRGLALALQQRIGGHGGAHLHALHLRGRHGFAGLQTQQVANAGHRGIAVLPRVFRQQFVRDQPAIGPAPHDVSEGAAPVNPELPAG